MINPGARPVEGATEDQATRNLQVFVYEATERGLHLAGDPERQPDVDTEGRYGWVLPLGDGGRVEVLMPGAAIAQVRDDLSAHAYCVRVDGSNWWWNDAVGMVLPATGP